MNLHVSCIMYHVSRKHRASRKAQSTLEVTLAFVIIFILLFAAVRIFIWLAETMVHRQWDYEGQRANVTDMTKVYVIGQKPPYVDESKYLKLDILGENAGGGD